MSKNTSKKSKVVALGRRIQLHIDDPAAGTLDMSSVSAAKEKGKVIGLGNSVTLDLKVGDTVYFKSWAVDIITDGTDKFYFIDQDTQGICAVVK